MGIVRGGTDAYSSRTETWYGEVLLEVYVVL